MSGSDHRVKLRLSHLRIQKVRSCRESFAQIDKWFIVYFVRVYRLYTDRVWIPTSGFAAKNRIRKWGSDSSVETNLLYLRRWLWCWHLSLYRWLPSRIYVVSINLVLTLPSTSKLDSRKHDFVVDSVKCKDREPRL